MKKLALITLITLSQCANASINVTTSPNSVSTTVGSKFGAFSKFSVQIANTTNETQNYSYNASLCPERNKCEQRIRNITILPNDIFNDQFQLATTVFYNQSGVYKNYATVIVNGYENKTVQNMGVFTIYKK